LDKFGRHVLEKLKSLSRCFQPVGQEYWWPIRTGYGSITSHIKAQRDLGKMGSLIHRKIIF